MKSKNIKVVIYVFFLIFFISNAKSESLINNELENSNQNIESEKSDIEENNKINNEIENSSNENELLQDKKISQDLEYIPEIFNFKQILEYTYYNNDVLNAEKEKTKSIESLKLKSYSNFLPEIGVDLNYGYIDVKEKSLRSKIYDDDGKIMDNKIYLQQPIFKSGRTYNQISSVKKKILIQESNLYQKKQEILFNTIQSILELIENKQIYELTKKNEETFKSNFEYVKTKKKIGKATISELSLAKSRYTIAKTNTIVANTNYINSKTNFLKITKINPMYIDIDYESIFKNSFEYNVLFEEILEKVLTKNPNLSIAKNNYEMNKNDFNYTKTSFLPELYLNAQYGRTRIADLSNELAGSASLNLRIPIFQSGTEYANYKEKRHSLNESKFSLNNVKDELIKETIEIYDKFLSSKNLIISSEDEKVATKIALDNTIIEEKIGKASITDVLDRRSEYFNSEISHLKNKNNLILYYYMLQMLAGELDLENIK